MTDKEAELTGQKEVQWKTGCISCLKVSPHKMVISYKEKKNNHPGSHCLNQVVKEGIMGKKTLKQYTP